MYESDVKNKIFNRMHQDIKNHCELDRNCIDLKKLENELKTFTRKNIFWKHGNLEPGAMQDFEMFT